MKKLLAVGVALALLSVFLALPASAGEPKGYPITFTRIDSMRFDRGPIGYKVTINFGAATDTTYAFGAPATSVSIQSQTTTYKYQWLGDPKDLLKDYVSSGQPSTYTANPRKTQTRLFFPLTTVGATDPAQDFTYRGGILYVRIVGNGTAGSLVVWVTG
jgi:hypothetical protein